MSHEPTSAPAQLIQGAPVIGDGEYLNGLGVVLGSDID